MPPHTRGLTPHRRKPFRGQKVPPAYARIDRGSSRPVRLSASAPPAYARIDPPPSPGHNPPTSALRARADQPIFTRFWDKAGLCAPRTRADRPGVSPLLWIWLAALNPLNSGTTEPTPRRGSQRNANASQAGHRRTPGAAVSRAAGRGGRCRYRLVRVIPVFSTISAMVSPSSRRRRA